MDAFQKPISSPLPSKQNNVIFRKALISNRRDQLVSFRYEPCEKLIPADVKEFTLQHILRPASNIIKKKKTISELCERAFSKNIMSEVEKGCNPTQRQL